MAVSSPLAQVRRSIRSWRSAAKIAASVNRVRVGIPEAMEQRVMFSALPAGFQEADIGTVGTAGTSSYDAASGTFTVNGAGNDLFASADSFHYVYTQITGNGTFVAHVASTTAAATDAPIGIDARTSLTATAANLFEAVTPAGNLVLNDRTSDGAVGNNLGQLPITQPYWLKIVRTGNTLSAYISGDGITFGLVQSQTLTGIGNSLFVGLAVASHDPAALATGTFDHVAAASYGAIPASMQEADIGVVGDARPHEFCQRRLQRVGSRQRCLRDRRCISLRLYKPQRKRQLYRSPDGG